LYVLKTEYQKELFELRFLEVELRSRRKSNTKTAPGDDKKNVVGPLDSEKVWRKAARHETLTPDDNPYSKIITSKKSTD
jgi:hypothetical protein